MVNKASPSPTFPRKMPGPVADSTGVCLFQQTEQTKAARMPWPARLQPADEALSRLRRRRSDRAAHASPAQPAISRWVLGEILLVVVLREIERRRVEDLGGDGIEARGLEGLLVHRLRSFGSLGLAGVEDINAGTILRAGVVPLAHALGRIVALPECLE